MYKEQETNETRTNATGTNHSESIADQEAATTGRKIQGDTTIKDHIVGFRNFYFFLAKAITFTAMIAIFYHIYARYYQEATFYFKGNVLFLLVYTFLFACFLYTYRGMQIGSQRYRDLVAAVWLTCVISDLASYFIICLVARKMLSILPILAAFIVQVSFGMVSYLLLQRLLWRLRPAMEAIAIIQPDDGRTDANVGEENESVVLAPMCHPDRENLKKFAAQNTRFQVKKIIDTEIDPEDIPGLLAAYRAVVLGQVDKNLYSEVLKYSFHHKKKVVLLPDVQDVLSHSATPLVLGDALVFIFRDHKLSPDQLAIKRFIDIVFSLLLVVLSLPFGIAAALAVKLHDKGPILFKQTRLTRNGAPFTLLKFRSMCVDAEQDTGAVRASNNDARITPVGRFIRKTRIDELPQLWNVLRGDMSLVGPRPERPELYDEIVKTCPEYRDRMAVKAGLTGYAQLYGKYNTSFHNKLMMDLYYIEMASLLLDLKLILYTVKIIFSKESTEGVKEKSKGNVVTEVDMGEVGKNVADEASKVSA